MIRKMLSTAALAAGFCAQANAAHYVTVSVLAGLHYTATFDMTSADADGTVYADNGNFSADIYNHGFEVFGWNADFVYLQTYVDLSGFDLTPSTFHYHQAFPDGQWVGAYEYYIDQYSFVGFTGGGAYNLDIVGTDNPRSVGLQVAGNSTAPSVPEPASWAMMLGGFSLVGGAMRARRKTALTFA